MAFIFIPLFIILFTILISIVYFSITCSISPMPTSGPVKKVIIELMKKYYSGHRVFELGSGWGTLAFEISLSFSGVQVYGFERSPVPYLYSKFVKKILGRKNVKLEYKDFFKTDLNETDMIICYLSTDLMTKLKDKLDKEMKPGSLLISNTFAVPGWIPVETIRAGDLFRSCVYVYKKG